MATRSPEGQHESPATDNANLEEAPSAKAELKIFMLPADDDPPDPETAGGPPGPVAVLLRRIGLDVRAGVRVPPADASEMLASIRRMWLAATWALTALITIAITVPAGTPVTDIIIFMVIELAGFTIGALAPPRRRRPR